MTVLPDMHARDHVGKVQIRVPAALRQYWGGGAGARVTVEVKTVAEALGLLGPLASRVLDDTGALRRHVHVFLNQDAVRDIDAPVAEGDIIHILPAVSGGSAP